MDKNMKAKIEGYIAKGQNKDAVHDSLKAEGFSMFAAQFHLDQYINENGEIKPIQLNYCSFCDMTLPQGEECKCQVDTNKESISLETFGSFTVGKGEKKVPSPLKQSLSNIDENYRLERPYTFYVGGNIGPKRVYFQTSCLREAYEVAGNVSASHSRVTVNEKKPRGKNKPIYTKADTPHYYIPGKFGKPW